MFATIAFILLFLLLLSLAYAGLLFAPWVPTAKKDTARILQLIDAKPNQRIYELGSGTGHITLALAKETSAIVKGVELVFPLFLYSFLKGKLQRSRALFYWKNFFRMDFSDADCLYLFGTPKPLAKRLREKIEQECKPGTKIVSYVFAFPDWEPIEISKPTEKDLSIYVYKLKTA